MPLPDEEGEVLFVSRRSLLLPTLLGAVFLAVGVWVVRAMSAKDESWFMWVWGSIWFLGSGAALLSGIRGLFVSPPRFARLGDDGLRLHRQRAPLIPWSQIVEARLGPKTMQGNDGSTTHVFRHPLILRLRDRSGFPTGGLKSRAFPMSPMPDGTLEWMVPLDGCPCDERDFLAKIHARLNPGRTPPPTSPPEPILPVLGTRRLDRPHRPSVVTPLFALLFVGAGLFFAGKGVESYRRGAASLSWPVAAGTILEAKLERGGESPNLRVRYAYRAQGRDFTGKRLAFAADSADYPAWAGRFQPGARVDVRYDPADPSEAVLVPGNLKAARFIVGFGLVFAAAGFWPILSYFRARRRLEAWLRENPEERA